MSSATKPSKPNRSLNLPELPAELQLRILHYCLVSSTPILNLGSRKWIYYPKKAGNPWRDFEKHGETHGQDELALNILFTCRTYRYEGWKIFWHTNQFIYSQPPACKNRLISEKFLRPASMTMMRHLSIRWPKTNRSYATVFCYLVQAFEICVNFKNLDTFGVHIDTDTHTFQVTPCHIIGLLRNLRIKEVSVRDSESPLVYPVTLNSSKGLDLASRTITNTHNPSTKTTNSKSGEKVTTMSITGFLGDGHALEPLVFDVLSKVLRNGTISFGTGLEARLYDHHFRHITRVLKIRIVPRIG